MDIAIESLDQILQISSTLNQSSFLIVEPKANGYGILDTARQRFPQLVQYAARPNTSKEARSAACEPLVRGGRVLIPAPHLSEWVHALSPKLLASRWHRMTTRLMQ